LRRSWEHEAAQKQERHSVLARLVHPGPSPAYWSGKIIESAKTVWKSRSWESSTWWAEAASSSARRRASTLTRAHRAPSREDVADVAMRLWSSSGGNRPIRWAWLRRMKLRIRPRRGRPTGPPSAAPLPQEDGHAGADGGRRQLEFPHVAPGEDDRAPLAGRRRAGPLVEDKLRALGAGSHAPAKALGAD